MKLSESLKELGHPVAYYPVLARVFGMQESIFLSQFVYWTGKQTDPDGWIYKSTTEIMEETGLTYEQQQRVRKVLGASERYGHRGKRIKRVHFDKIIEEKYVREEHKMYFRINFEAMDRAFSGNLFSGIQSGALGYYPHAHLGITHKSTWVKPISSIQRLHTETTYRDSARKDAHKEFIGYWSKMVELVRSVEKSSKEYPLFDQAGFRNLKMVLKRIDESTLERLGLYFLASPEFKKFSPKLRVFLSKGVWQALGRAQTKDGFSARVNSYVDQYMGLKLKIDTNSRKVGIKELNSVITELSEKLLIK